MEHPYIPIWNVNLVYYVLERNLQPILQILIAMPNMLVFLNLMKTVRYDQDFWTDVKVPEISMHGPVLAQVSLRMSVLRTCHQLLPL